MENKACDIIHKLCSFYEDEWRNENCANYSYFYFCVKILNQIKHKNNHVSSASEVASIFLRGIVLMLTTYILTIATEYESAKTFLYQPVIPFYNAYDEMAREGEPDDRKNDSMMQLRNAKWAKGEMEQVEDLGDTSEEDESTRRDLLPNGSNISSTLKNHLFDTLSNDMEDRSSCNSMYSSFFSPSSSLDTENKHFLMYAKCQRKKKSWIPLVSSPNQGLLDDVISHSDDSGSHIYINKNKLSDFIQTSLESINDENMDATLNQKKSIESHNSKSRTTRLSEYYYNSDESEEFYIRKNLQDYNEMNSDSNNFKTQLNGIMYKFSKKKKYMKNGKKLKHLRKKIMKYKNDSKKLNFIFSLLEEILKIMLGVGLRVLSSISYHYLYEKNGMHKFIYIFGSKVIRNDLNDKTSFLELCENMIKPKSLTLLQACNFIISGIIPCLGYVTNLFVDKKSNRYSYIKELKNYLSLKMALNIWPMFLKIALQGLLTSRHLSFEMSVHKDSLHPIAECCISITSLATHFLTFFTVMSDNVSKYEIYVNMRKNLMSASPCPIPLILINAAKYIRISSKRNKYYEFEKAIRTILLQLTDCSVCGYENYLFNHYIIPESISSFLSATKMTDEEEMIKEGSPNSILTNRSNNEINISELKSVAKSYMKTYKSMYAEEEVIRSNNFEGENLGSKTETEKAPTGNESTKMCSKTNIEFLKRLMNNDKDAVKYLGTFYNVFHKNFERAQIAFVAVFLYLIGYNHSHVRDMENDAQSGLCSREKKESALINEALEMKKINIACNLARQGVIDLISKCQIQHQKRSIECKFSSKSKRSEEKANDKSMEFLELYNKEVDEVEEVGGVDEVDEVADREGALDEKQQSINSTNSDEQNEFICSKNVAEHGQQPLSDAERDGYISCNLSKEELNYLNDVLPNTEKCSNKSSELPAVDLIKKKREKQIDKILKKCEWIINTYPHGLCPIVIKDNFSHKWDEHFVFMRRNSYDIPITARKIYSDRSDFYLVQEAATMPTFASSLKTNVSSLSYFDQILRHPNNIDEKLECIQFSTENIFGKGTTKNLCLLKRLLKTYKRNVSLKDSNNGDPKSDKENGENAKQLYMYVGNSKARNFSNSCPSCDSANFYNDESNFYMNYNFCEKNNDNSNNSIIMKYSNHGKNNVKHAVGGLWQDSRLTKNYIFHHGNDVTPGEELNSTMVNCKSDFYFFSPKSLDENDFISRNGNNGSKWDCSAGYVTKYTNSMLDYEENLSDHNLSEVHNKCNGLSKSKKIFSMHKQEFMRAYHDEMKNKQGSDKKKGFPSFDCFRGKVTLVNSKDVDTDVIVNVNSIMDQNIDSKDLLQLKEILSFLISDTDLDTVLNIIRIEQLTTLCRYLISRSLKSMLCAGIFGGIKNPIVNMKKNNNVCPNKRSQKGYNSNSDDIKKKKKSNCNEKSVDKSGFCASENYTNVDNTNSGSVNLPVGSRNQQTMSDGKRRLLETHIPSGNKKEKGISFHKKNRSIALCDNGKIGTLRDQRKYKNFETNKKYSKDDKRKKGIFEQWRQKSAKSMQWPVILDLLVPSSSRGTYNEDNKVISNIEPSLFSVQNYGWMLLKLLHIITIKFRNVSPLKNVITQMNEGGKNGGSSSSSCGGAPGGGLNVKSQFSHHYWFTQPMEHALSFTLTDITKSTCIWYLRYNRKMLMNSSNFSQIIKNSMNTLWIESVLRLIALQICLRVKPLNDSRYVVPFLYHMLTICQPLLREVHIDSENLKKKHIAGNRRTIFMDANNSLFEVMCSHCHKCITGTSKNVNSKIFPIGKNLKNIRKINSSEMTYPKKACNTSEETKNLLDVKGYIHSERVQKKIKQKVLRVRNYNSSEHEHEHEVILDNVITGIVVYHETVNNGEPVKKKMILQNLSGFKIKKEYTHENQYWALCTQQYSNSPHYTLPLRNVNKSVKHTNRNIFQSVGDESNSCYWSISGDPVYNIYGNSKAISDVQLEICVNKNYDASVRSFLKKNNFELELSINNDVNDVINIWTKKKAIIINKELIECTDPCAASLTGNSSRKEKSVDNENELVKNELQKVSIEENELINSVRRRSRFENYINRNYEHASEHVCQCRKFSTDYDLPNDNNDCSYKSVHSENCKTGTSMSTYDENDNLNYKKLKLISWNLIKTILWGILVSGENSHGENSDQVVSESRTKCVKNNPSSNIPEDINQEYTYGNNYTDYKSQFYSLQRKSLIESVLKMIMSVLIKLCNIVKLYNDLTKNQQGSFYIRIGNTKICKQQVKDCEKMITDFMYSLINCVQNSPTGAVTLLRCFLFGQDNPTYRFKKLNKLNINCNFYRLITECIKKAPNDADDITVFFKNYFDKKIVKMYGIDQESNSMNQVRKIKTTTVAPVRGSTNNAAYNSVTASPKENLNHGSCIRHKGTNMKMSNFFFKNYDTNVMRNYKQSKIHGFFLLRCLPPIKMFPKQLILQETKKLFHSEVSFSHESSTESTPKEYDDRKGVNSANETCQNDELPVNTSSKENISSVNYQMDINTANNEGNSQCNSINDILGLIPRVSYRNHPFDELPQSEFFMSSRPSDDFEANMEGRVLRVLRGLNLGGVVLCLAPLTFPALNIGPNEVNDIINFRIQTRGRFGVTVAPAECVLTNVSEVFDRNDVVGFRTNMCPPFRHDVFAANVQYELGDLLSVKFNVEDQQNQKCLRTELMVSGVSIGSVLEVLFEADSQIEFERRMNLIFIFQDPMTIVYEGPTFSMEYVDPKSKKSRNARNERKNLDEEYLNEFYAIAGHNKKNIKKQLKKIKLKKKEFYESVKLYQSILDSDNEILKDLKHEVIIRMNTTLTSVADHLRKNSSAYLFMDRVGENFSRVSNLGNIPHFNKAKSPKLTLLNTQSCEALRNKDPANLGKERPLLDKRTNKYVHKKTHNSVFSSTGGEKYEGREGNARRSDMKEEFTLSDQITYNIINFSENANGADHTNNDVKNKELRNRPSEIDKLVQQRSDQAYIMNQNSSLYVNVYNKKAEAGLDINKCMREVLSIICVLGLNVNPEEKKKFEDKNQDGKNSSIDELPWLSSLSELKNSVAYSLDRKCVELFFCNLVDIICSDVFLHAIFNFITKKLHKKEDAVSKVKHSTNGAKNNKKVKKRFQNLSEFESKKVLEKAADSYNQNRVNNENSTNSTNTLNEININNCGCMDNSVTSGNANSNNDNSLLNSIFIEENGSLEEHEESHIGNDNQEIFIRKGKLKLADTSLDNKGPYFKNISFSDKVSKNGFFEYSLCLIGTKAIMCCCILLRTLLEMNSDGFYKPNENVYGSFKKLLSFIKVFFFVDIGISDALIVHFARRNSVNVEHLFGSGKRGASQGGDPQRGGHKHIDEQNTTSEPAVAIASSFVDSFLNKAESENCRLCSEDAKDAYFAPPYASEGKSSADKEGTKNEQVNLLEILTICGIPSDFFQYFNITTPVIKNQQVITQNDTFDLWIYILNLLACFNSQSRYSLCFPQNVHQLSNGCVKSALFDFEYSNSSFSNKIVRKTAKFFAGWLLKKYLIDLSCVMASLLPKLFMDELRESLVRINEGAKIGEQVGTINSGCLDLTTRGPIPCNNNDTIMKVTNQNRRNKKNEIFSKESGEDKTNMMLINASNGKVYDSFGDKMDGEDSQNYFGYDPPDGNKNGALSMDDDGDYTQDDGDESLNNKTVHHNSERRCSRIRRRSNKRNNISELMIGALKNKEEMLNIFSVMYLFRICIYYLSRSKDFRKEDYWQEYQGQIRNSKMKQNVYKLLNEKSCKSSLLFGWQRIFYQCVITWDDKQLVDQLLLIIQSELLYHLVGSIAQSVSQKRVKVDMFYAISPSVHVAHWMLDTFVRHPLCPSRVRSCCVTPLAVTSLFGLIMNGNRLPIFIGIDACRLVYWSCVVYILQNSRSHKRYKKLQDIDMLTQFGVEVETMADDYDLKSKDYKNSLERKNERYNTLRDKYQRVKCNYHAFLSYLFNCVHICGSSLFNQILNLNRENNYKSANGNKNKAIDISNNNVRNNNEHVNNIIDNLNNNINNILSCIQNSANNRMINNNFNGISSVSNETIYNLNITNRASPNISSNNVNNNSLQENTETVNSCNNGNTATTANTLYINTTVGSTKNEKKSTHNFAHFDLFENKEKSTYSPLKINASLLIHYFACAAYYIKKVDMCNNMNYYDEHVHTNFKQYCLYLYVVDHVSKMYAKSVRRSGRQRGLPKVDESNHGAESSPADGLKKNPNESSQDLCDFAIKKGANNCSLQHSKEEEEQKKTSTFKGDKNKHLFFAENNKIMNAVERRDILDDPYEGNYPEMFVDNVLQLSKKVCANVIIDINEKIHHVCSPNADVIKLKIKDMFPIPKEKTERFAPGGRYAHGHHDSSHKQGTTGMDNHNIDRIMHLLQREKEELKHVTRKAIEHPSIVFSADNDFHYVLQEIKHNKVQEFLFLESKSLSADLDLDSVGKVNLGSHIELVDLCNLPQAFILMGYSEIYSGAHNSSFSISLGVSNKQKGAVHRFSDLVHIEVGLLNVSVNYDSGQKDTPHSLDEPRMGELKRYRNCKMSANREFYKNGSSANSHKLTENMLISYNNYAQHDVDAEKILKYSSFLPKSVEKKVYAKRANPNEYSCAYAADSRHEKATKQVRKNHLSYSAMNKRGSTGKRFSTNSYENEDGNDNGRDNYDNCLMSDSYNDISYSKTLSDMSATNSNDAYNRVNSSITLNIADGTVTTMGLFSDSGVEKAKPVMINKVSSADNITIKVKVIGKQVLWFSNDTLIFRKEFSAQMTNFVPLIKVTPIVPHNKLDEFQDSALGSRSIHMKFIDTNEKIFVSPLTNFYFKFENVHKKKYRNNCTTNMNKNWKKSLWKRTCFVLPDAAWASRSSTKVVKKSKMPHIIAQPDNEILIHYYNSRSNHLCTGDPFSNTLFLTPNMQIKSEPVNFDNFMHCKNVQGDKWNFLTLENVKTVRNVPVINYYGVANSYKQSEMNKIDLDALNNCEQKNVKVIASIQNITNIQKTYAKILETNTKKDMEKESSNIIMKGELNLNNHFNRLCKNEDIGMNAKSNFDIAHNYSKTNKSRSNERKKKSLNANVGMKANYYDVNNVNRTHYTSYYHELIPENNSRNFMHSNYINDYFTTSNDANMHIKYRLHNFHKIKKDYSYNVKYSSIQEINDTGTHGKAKYIFDEKKQSINDSHRRKKYINSNKIFCKEDHVNDNSYSFISNMHDPCGTLNEDKAMSNMYAPKQDNNNDLNSVEDYYNYREHGDELSNCSMYYIGCKEFKLCVDSYEALFPAKHFIFKCTVNFEECDNRQSANEVKKSVGILWGGYRWLWTSNGKFICPLKLPLCVSEFPPEKIEECEMEVANFKSNDNLCVEFEPHLQSLFFYKNGKYEFGFKFDTFYNYRNAGGNWVYEKSKEAARNVSKYSYSSSLSNGNVNDFGATKNEDVNKYRSSTNEKGSLPKDMHKIQKEQGMKDYGNEVDTTQGYMNSHFNSCHNTKASNLCAHSISNEHKCSKRVSGTNNMKSKEKRMNKDTSSSNGNHHEDVTEDSENKTVIRIKNHVNMIKLYNSLLLNDCDNVSSILMYNPELLAKSDETKQEVSFEHYEINQEDFPCELVSSMKNIIYEKDLTPLMLACRIGCEECVQKIIEIGKVNPNKACHKVEKETPLMVAAQYGYSRLVSMLVSVYGVQINKKDAKGNTALHKVLLNPCPDDGKKNCSSKMVQLLLKLGADISLVNKKGLSVEDLVQKNLIKNKKVESILKMWIKLSLKGKKKDKRSYINKDLIPGLLSNCSVVIGLPICLNNSSNSYSSVKINSFVIGGEELVTARSYKQVGSCDDEVDCGHYNQNNNEWKGRRTDEEYYSCDNSSRNMSISNFCNVDGKTDAKGEKGEKGEKSRKQGLSIGNHFLKDASDMENVNKTSDNFLGELNYGTQLNNFSGRKPIGRLKDAEDAHFEEPTNRLDPTDQKRKKPISYKADMNLIYERLERKGSNDSAHTNHFPSMGEGTICSQKENLSDIVMCENDAENYEDNENRGDNNRDGSQNDGESVATLSRNKMTRKPVGDKQKGNGQYASVEEGHSEDERESYSQGTPYTLSSRAKLCIDKNDILNHLIVHSRGDGKYDDTDVEFMLDEEEMLMKNRITQKEARSKEDLHYDDLNCKGRNIKKKCFVFSSTRKNMFNYQDLQGSLIEFINKSGVFSDIFKNNGYLDAKSIPKFDELKNTLMQIKSEEDVFKGFHNFLELFDYLYMDERLKYFMNIDLKKNLKSCHSLLDLGYILLKVDSFSNIFNSFKLKWNTSVHDEWKKKLLKGLGIFNEFYDIKWVTDSYTIYRYEEDMIESASLVDKVLQNGNNLLFYSSLMNIIDEKRSFLRNGMYDAHLFSDIFKNIDVENLNRDALLYDFCSNKNMLKEYLFHENNKRLMCNNDSSDVTDKYKNYISECFVNGGSMKGYEDHYSAYDTVEEANVAKERKSRKYHTYDRSSYKVSSKQYIPLFKISNDMYNSVNDSNKVGNPSEFAPSGAANGAANGAASTTANAIATAMGTTGRTPHNESNAREEITPEDAPCSSASNYYQSGSNNKNEFMHSGMHSEEDINAEHSLTKQISMRSIKLDIGGDNHHLSNSNATCNRKKSQFLCGKQLRNALFMLQGNCEEESNNGNALKQHFPYEASKTYGHKNGKNTNDFITEEERENSIHCQFSSNKNDMAKNYIDENNHFNKINNRYDKSRKRSMLNNVSKKHNWHPSTTSDHYYKKHSLDGSFLRDGYNDQNDKVDDEYDFMCELQFMSKPCDNDLIREECNKIWPHTLDTYVLHIYDLISSYMDSSEKISLFVYHAFDMEKIKKNSHVRLPNCGKE